MNLKLKGIYFNFKPVLNDFMALGYGAWKEARARLQELLGTSCDDLKENAELRTNAFVPMESATMYLPANIGEYFYLLNIKQKKCISFSNRFSSI